jgi:nicotinamidase-related amidase
MPAKNYVNDNFGRWQSDFRRQVQHCLRGESRGHEIAPARGGRFFVLKPKHSGFFSTTLETPIITGIAGNFCVLFTANNPTCATRI